MSPDFVCVYEQASVGEALDASGARGSPPTRLPGYS